MSAAPFRAVAGDIVSDHGWLTLREAEALARFYAVEAAQQTGAPARLCANRALALEVAAQAARRWRRAAGWGGPEGADAPGGSGGDRARCA